MENKNFCELIRCGYQEYYCMNHSNMCTLKELNPALREMSVPCRYIDNNGQIRDDVELEDCNCERIQVLAALVKSRR